MLKRIIVALIVGWLIVGSMNIGWFIATSDAVADEGGDEGVQDGQQGTENLVKG